tara:strand:+ start:466 stop:1032 length:567 start_codon:yes stop_codon:yes gene_type:complete
MIIRDRLIEISENFKNLASSGVDDIEIISKVMIDCLNSKNKIMFCGNGGSAADSQHLAAELVGRYRINRPPLSAIALSTDTSSITAIANDFSFDEIFLRQIKAIGRENDVLYAISTSGKSQNIISALETAKKMKIKTIGVTGFDGGNMNDLCDFIIKVPASTPDRIQELHIAVGQIICEIIENNFFNN